MGFSRCAVRGVENISDVSSYLAHHDFGMHIRTDILLQMVMAALPGNTSEHSSTGSLQSRMIIAGDQLYAAQPSKHQALQEGAPMNCRKNTLVF